MPENNNPPFRYRKGLGKNQRGGAAVEFALLVLIFLTLVFCILELARLVYMFNILQEVTRRAATLAANSNFDADTLDATRSRALFADRNGNLVLGAPITPAHVRIDYLFISRDGGTGAVTPEPVAALPANPTQNYTNCVANPYSPSCIRLVRVRICQPGGAGECTAVPYEMQFPLIDLSGLTLPRSETIVPALTLGHRFNTAAGS